MYCIGCASGNKPGLVAMETAYPAGTKYWINVESEFRTTARPFFNYISTSFQSQMPAGYIPHNHTLTVY